MGILCKNIFGGFNKGCYPRAVKLVPRTNFVKDKIISDSDGATVAASTDVSVQMYQS